ncbi:MAG: UDP-2,3-diacylglucosamine diphosphatase [Gammaproteobacteria bacterium]|jgi:UDP-2,3-diacylglucosamine hydrolase|nr:UDP-2,3-diacylglucosamine diphosphatase [Gammaproteobacteria bacterium]MBT5201924.1 UDP-2,3-diacylglucosamine diphosphatase [Gammaproteobacteria bacterium]MBT5602441.1 UDP-2,3-diacylglucosamine diphosphatase [Gammaproteobacteria bacterium]MBT6245229.1 UDP-2,3-diacylglucosamine diphosphatase [Gammaproteobacteria bacterium]
MTGTRYLFISDLHLEPSRKEISEAFIGYLETLTRQDQLYILGDLFEVWLGDDDDSQFNLSIIEALHQCRGDIYLMHGNRDFLIGSKFADQANLTLLPDPFIVNLFGEPVLLLHGDSLCTLDTEYMAIRNLLRSEPFQSELLSKTLSERAEIARQARNESQQHTAQTELQIMDVTPEEVQRTFTEQHVTTMIHGHTHRPFDHFNEHASPPFRRLVLGDWDKYGWQIIAADNTLKLSRFPIA